MKLKFLFRPLGLPGDFFSHNTLSEMYRTPVLNKHRMELYFSTVPINNKDDLREGWVFYKLKKIGGA